MNTIEIASPQDLQAAVRAAVQAALERQARSLLFVDHDLSGWPLSDAPLLDSLTAWLRRPQRRLVLLSQRWDRLERAHPRFVQWRMPWSHAIDAREPTDEAAAQELPTLLLDDGPTVLELWQRDPPRGRAASDAAAAAAVRDRIDAPLQRSAPAWPVKPLGL
jgi:hypothetical protein